MSKREDIEALDQRLQNHTRHAAQVLDEILARLASLEGSRSVFMQNFDDEAINERVEALGRLEESLKSQAEWIRKLARRVTKLEGEDTVGKSDAAEIERLIKTGMQAVFDEQCDCPKCRMRRAMKLDDDGVPSIKGMIDEMRQARKQEVAEGWMEHGKVHEKFDEPNTHKHEFKPQQDNERVQWGGWKRCDCGAIQEPEGWQNEAAEAGVLIDKGEQASQETQSAFGRAFDTSLSSVRARLQKAVAKATREALEGVDGVEVEVEVRVKRQ